MTNQMLEKQEGVKSAKTAPALPVELPLCERAVQWLSEHAPGPKRIVLGTHLEVKAAVWAKILSDHGVDVLFVPSNAESTHKDAYELVRSFGIPVATALDIERGVDKETFAEVLSFAPTIVFDDGAILIKEVAAKQERFPSVKGCVEFTTSGINEVDKISSWPILDMARSFCKHEIGNPRGTGESGLSAIMSLTNKSMAGARVGVIGYGAVGRGFANLARQLGAVIYVAEIDLKRKTYAHFDGMRVAELPELLKSCELVVTSTGATDTIGKSSFKDLKDGATLANVGCFRNELPLAELREAALSVSQPRPGIDSYHMADKTIHLLKNGELVNISCGGGWPVEYIDLTFALSTLCFGWLHNSRNENNRGIVAVPDDLENLALRWFLERAAAKS
ncbi:MAG: NAD(P)-dependent oxidoreductase [Elusimicrobiota bacterium]